MHVLSACYGGAGESGGAREFEGVSDVVDGIRGTGSGGEFGCFREFGGAGEFGCFREFGGTGERSVREFAGSGAGGSVGRRS